MIFKTYRISVRVQVEKSIMDDSFRISLCIFLYIRLVGLSSSCKFTGLIWGIEQDSHLPLALWRNFLKLSQTYACLCVTLDLCVCYFWFVTHFLLNFVSLQLCIHMNINYNQKKYNVHTQYLKLQQLETIYAHTKPHFCANRMWD